jgi:hypothetical protein
VGAERVGEIVGVILGLLGNKWVATALAIAAAIFAFHEWDVKQIQVANEKKIAQQVIARASDIEAGKTEATALNKKIDDAAALRKTEADKFATELGKARSKNVTPNAVKSCNLTAGVIMQHNLSAEGRAAIPNDSGVAVDRPAGIKIDQYSAAVENNYGRCHENAKQLLDWQQWAISTCRTWNKRWDKTDPCPSLPDAIAGQSESAFGAEKGK